MHTQHDLGPAARLMKDLLGGIRDDQLTARTPCVKYSVADLVEHVYGAANGLVAMSRGQTGKRRVGDASRLSPEWRKVIPATLDDLVKAWSDPAAWEGTISANGVELPAHNFGLGALEELTVHAWDIAVASGQRYTPRPEDVTAALGILNDLGEEFRVRNGGYGPNVKVPSDAPEVHKMLGASGRTPYWRP
jgi:uncharacterized protein (TIGR03086 family)